MRPTEEAASGRRVKEGHSSLSAYLLLDWLVLLPLPRLEKGKRGRGEKEIWQGGEFLAKTLES